MPVLEFAFALVDGNLAVVHFHVLHESPPVLDPFLDHTKPNNKSQRRDHADGGEGAHRGEREDGGEEEVEVGDAAELLEDGLGEEGEDVVLGRGDVVGRVLERLPAVHGGVVAVDDAREPRAADGAAALGGGPAAGGLVVAVGGAEAGEGVELAPSQAVAPPPAGTAHTGSRRGVGDRPIPPRDARGRRRGGEGEARRAWVDWGAEREEREGRERERRRRGKEVGSYAARERKREKRERE